MNELLMDVVDREVRYIGNLENHRVSPSVEALERLSFLDEPLPTQSTDPQTVLRILDEIGSPATVASTGGRYFGFVIGGSLPAPLTANWLAWAWHQNACMDVASPIASALETVCLKWLLEDLSLPPNFGRGFVTGATMANFTGLAAARHALLQSEGWDVQSQGFFGVPPITVIVGEEVHVSVLKALGSLGLGRDRVQRVPVDGQGRMRSDALPGISGPTIVCLQSGNVNTGAFTGAFDPAGEVCAQALESGAWVHVDGTFGLRAAAAPRRAHLISGVSDADSWATDAHK